jgi:hypothetical protein
MKLIHPDELALICLEAALDIKLQGTNSVDCSCIKGDSDE